MQERQDVSDLSDLVFKMVGDLKVSRKEQASQLQDYRSALEEHGKAKALVGK